MTPRVLARATGWMVVPLRMAGGETGLGRGWGNKHFCFQHVKLETACRYPKG